MKLQKGGRHEGTDPLNRSGVFVPAMEFRMRCVNETMEFMMLLMRMAAK